MYAEEGVVSWHINRHIDGLPAILLTIAQESLGAA
jgi:hypothetical protein